MIIIIIITDSVIISHDVEVRGTPAVHCWSWQWFVQARKSGVVCKMQCPVSPQAHTSIISPGIEHPLKPAASQTYGPVKCLVSSDLDFPHYGQPPCRGGGALHRWPERFLKSGG